MKLEVNELKNEVNDLRIGIKHSPKIEELQAKNSALEFQLNDKNKKIQFLGRVIRKLYKDIPQEKQLSHAESIKNVQELTGIQM